MSERKEILEQLLAAFVSSWIRERSKENWMTMYQLNEGSFTPLPVRLIEKNGIQHLKPDSKRLLLF